MKNSDNNSNINIKDKLNDIEQVYCEKCDSKPCTCTKSEETNQNEEISDHQIEQIDNSKERPPKIRWI